MSSLAISQQTLPEAPMTAPVVLIITSFFVKTMSGVVELAVIRYLDYQPCLVHDRKLKLVRRCRGSEGCIYMGAYITTAFHCIWYGGASWHYNYFINYLINPHLLSSKNRLFIDVWKNNRWPRYMPPSCAYIGKAFRPSLLPRNLILLNVCIRFESLAVGRGRDGASRHFAIKYRRLLPCAWARPTDYLMSDQILLPISREIKISFGVTALITRDIYFKKVLMWTCNSFIQPWFIILKITLSYSLMASFFTDFNDLALIAGYFKATVVQ